MVESCNRSPKGNMWSAIPVALLCMIVNRSERKGTKSCTTQGDRGETLSPLVSSSLSLFSLSFSLLSIKERDLVSRGRSPLSRPLFGFDKYTRIYSDLTVFSFDIPRALGSTVVPYTGNRTPLSTMPLDTRLCAYLHAKYTD